MRSREDRQSILVNRRGGGHWIVQRNSGQNTSQPHLRERGNLSCCNPGALAEFVLRESSFALSRTDDISKRGGGGGGNPQEIQAGMRSWKQPQTKVGLVKDVPGTAQVLGTQETQEF